MNTGQGQRFLVFIGGHTAHSQIPVDQVAVEFGPVYTGKLGLSAYTDPTRTTHAGTVNHNGIHADYGGNTISSVVWATKRIMIVDP